MFQSNIYWLFLTKKTGEYVTTTDILGTKKETKLESGPVNVDIDAYKTDIFKMGYDNWCVASILWKYCFTLLNNAMNQMKISFRELLCQIITPYDKKFNNEASTKYMLRRLKYLNKKRTNE